MGRGRFKSGMLLPKMPLTVAIRKSAYLKRHSRLRFTITDTSSPVFALGVPRCASTARPQQ